MPTPNAVSKRFKALYGYFLYILGYSSPTPSLQNMPDEIILEILGRLPGEDLNIARQTSTLLAYPGSEVTDRESLWQTLSQAYLLPWRNKHFKDRVDFNYPISSPEGSYIQLLGKIQAVAGLPEISSTRARPRLEPSTTLFISAFANSASLPSFDEKKKIARLKKKFDTFLLVLEYNFLVASGTRFPATISTAIITTHFNTDPITEETTTFWKFLDNELERVNTEKLLAALQQINLGLPLGGRIRNNESHESRVNDFNRWLSLQTEKKLSLAWKNFTRVPKIIGLIDASESIDLSDNNIIFLPEQISLLASLHTLNLSRNKIVSLPEGVRGLTALRQLNLTSNLISTLPIQLYALTTLQILNLTSNQLTYLSEKIVNLVDLSELRVGINFLSNIPDSLGRLQKLTMLSFETNLLTTIPKLIRNLSQLTVLNLNDNQIKNLPPAIGELIGLQKLLIERNKLTQLPAELRALTQLKVLALRGNPFASLPSWVRDFTLIEPTGCEAVTEKNPAIRYSNRPTPK